MSPDGVRDKLKIFKLNLGDLVPEESSRMLANCIENGLVADNYHQFYAEEVEHYLHCGAEVGAVVTNDRLPLLHAVLLNDNLRESVALRSCELLQSAYRKQRKALSAKERELLEEKHSGSSQDLRDRWKSML
mmetsp:Transcript_26050/g.52180  ORF Transcript_26050/g.52180 Transcript_26050/m.52180 type:complete len:132 (+) Transcript_26050:3-398(+)